MKTAEARNIALIEDQSVTQGGCERDAAEPKASARAITMNFITGGLGSAIFSLPWSVAGSSVITSIVIVGIVLLLNAWTISIIVQAGERYKVFELGGVLANFPFGLGRPMQMVTDVFVWISLFLCLVSYIIVIHDSAMRLVGGTWLDSRFLIVALASVFVLPLCFLSQRMLARTSSLAIMVNIYLFALIGTLYGQGSSHGTLPEGSCILGSTIRGNFAMVTVMFNSVILQMCVLPMYKPLKNRSPQRFNKIIAVGFSTLFILFCGFSCIGYLLIGPKVQSNILADLPKGPAETIAQVGTILVIGCVYPIMVYPMIAPIADREGTLCGLNRKTAATGAKFIIVAAAMVTALCVSSLGMLNSVNGAMSALIFVVLIPSLIGLTLLDASKCHKAALIVLLICGSAVACMGLVFDKNYVENLRCLWEA